MSAAPLAERLAVRLLRRRGAAAAVAAAVTAASLPLAGRVPVALEIEQAFPIEHPDRAAYQRYRTAFPGEEARAAVVLSADDALAPAGVARLAAVEIDLRGLPGVVSTLSPASVRTVVPTRFGPVAEPLLREGLDPAEHERRLEAATRDPLLAWTLLRPDRTAAFVLVALAPETAGTAAGRDRFTRDARAMLDRHVHPGQSLLLTGMPVMRARLASLLRDDLVRIVPAALLAVFLIVLAAFRSARAGAAALAAAATSLAWTAGALGASGRALGFALGLLPVLVVIVSVGDSVHLLSAFERRRLEGAGPREAAAGALAEVAGPCLVTELVLAAGFLSLVLVNVRAIADLGLATAVAMPLTWAATMLVTALALSLGPRRRETPRAPRAHRGLAPASPRAPALRAAGAVVSFCARTALRRPGRVLLGTGVVLAGALALALRVERVDFVFDDVPEGSPLGDEIRAVETAYGGYVPIALHIEADGGDAPALEPACLRLADRAGAFLRTFPEVTAVASAADLLRKAHLAFSGPGDTPDDLPDDRDVAEHELRLLGDARVAAPFLSADRRSLAVVARMPDVGSRRAAEIYAALDAWIAREGAAPREAPGIRLTATGPLRLFVAVDRDVAGGLLRSFGGALLVSLAVMAAALRSWRLGLVALVPNALPMILVLAFLGLAGIPLQAATALVFSIALVVADDDTIQLLSRFRRRHVALDGLADPGRHRRAMVGALREAGPPMVLTAVAVSAAFSLLFLSSLVTTARVGYLLGATLLAAAAADLFLTPLLVTRLRPLARRGGAARGPPGPPAAGTGGGAPPGGRPG